MRRRRVRVRPLSGLLLFLLLATSALAWKQSRSTSGVQPLLRVPSGSLAFVYEQDGAPSMGAANTHAAWDNARATINALATAEVTAGRGANFNLMEPIDDNEPGGVASDGFNRVFVFTTDVNNDTPAGVLAFAAAFHNINTGDIAECDVAFNDADFDWNTANPDMQSVATHEFIHCYGISHSAVVGNFNTSGHEVRGSFTGDFTQHATMFPSASGTTNERTLHGDDIAALSDLYPNAQTTANLGTISGNVTDGGGNPVVGAHVVAVSTSAPNTPVAGFFSNTDEISGGTGAYRLLVPPGNYFVRVEPIIGFPNTFRQSNITHPVTFRSNFPPEFYSGVNESASDAMPDNLQNDAAAVTVMAGQTTSGINIVINNLAPFTHDDFVNRRIISTNPFREAVDASAATTEGTDPTGSCFGRASAFTAWYSFTAPSGGDITFSIEGSHYDTAVAAFTGGPGGFVEVACSEDLGSPSALSNVQSKITFPATAGTTYHFLISDSDFAGLPITPPSFTEFLLVVNLSVEGNPVPSLSTISPSSAVAGGAGFTLTLNGSNFINGSIVRWNGADRTTTFINSGQLQAAIPAGDLVNAGTAQVTVFNPTPGGGTSNSLSFNVLSPVISSLTPHTIPATSPGFELKVNGSNFHAGSVVRWNGTDRTTTFVSSTQLTANIPASDLAAVGTAQVTVRNSAGGISNAATFTINIRNPLPTITGLSPAGVLEDGPGFTLTVNGSNFVFNSTVQLGGSNRTTTFVNRNRLQASILAGDITTVGTKNITVVSPGPGGGTSNTFGLPVQMSANPPPTTTSLNPTNIIAGTERNTLSVQVNGSNFVNGASVVRWNGSNRLTTFNSDMQLIAQIPASDLLAAGTALVAVFTAGPGGGTSGTQAFTINNPLPATSSISPSSTVAGDPGLTLTVNGSNFVPGSKVRWDGSDRPTTFIGSNQLRAAIPASDLSGAGMHTVTVFTPGPGGGTSNGQTFTVNVSMAMASSSGRSGAERTSMSEGDSSSVSSGTSTDSPASLALGQAIALAGVAPVRIELESLEPRTLRAGSGEFTLTVRGKSFLPGSVVRWNGRDLATTVVSDAKLEATVPASHAATAGVIPITVFHPESGAESEPKRLTLTSR